MERIYRRLDDARHRLVAQEDNTIQDGGLDPWPYVEADEVDIRKSEERDELGGDGTPVIWEQWAGVVQRGLPKKS